MDSNGAKLIRHTGHSCELQCSRETALIQLIHDARDGDGTAVAELIESFRDYLLTSARGAISPAIQGKVAPSDLFQESFLAAEQGFPEFRGETLQELKAWLKQIVVRRATEAHRRYSRTAKRQVNREMPLGRDRLGDEVAGADTSPSTRAAADDEGEILRRAVDSLPPQYREVIILHHEQGLPFDQVSRHMKRSTEAAKKLWLRALAQLRKKLQHVQSTPL